MSSLIFIAAFGEENNQEKDDNYDIDVDDDYDDASTFASLIFIAALGEEDSQSVGDENSSRWRCEEACIFNLYCILRKNDVTMRARWHL